VEIYRRGHFAGAQFKRKASEMSVIDMVEPAVAPRSATSNQACSAPESQSLLEQYRARFETVLARSEEQVRQCQRIRFQVYSVENAFENPAEHPDGLERDGFDDHSVQSLLIHRASGQAIGTVRLILPVRDSEQSFAVQRVCDHPMLKRLALLPTAEVSRFSISKEFRRRSTDSLYEGESAPREAETENRSIAPLMSLGLIQSLVRMSAEYGITHWCATMEPKLLRLLARMGICFSPLGPMVEYHGMRQPCYCEVGPMLRRVQERQPAIWEILTDGGTLVSRVRQVA
jgi:N-acyl amino acid synthase of PEP-CTERM/exosortase system